MLFNSLEFAVFFPVVCCLYFATPHRARLPLLLVASCAFYMAFIPAYILILFVTIAIDYFAGIRIENTEGRARKTWLIVSILSTCMVLFVFKYFDFFTGNFVGLAHLVGWSLPKPVVHIILPIGLSFHTFQSLSYVIEVYYGRQKAEHNFIPYATYVMFFPQLVAGPIERPQNLLHQFYEQHEFDYDRITAGLKRMAWGFFKKLVVADRLALYVNDVYAAPRNFNGLQITLATFFFAYQIYCDFSGYSDIALGAAQVLGFKLMENFNTPYYSRSISEFWHRWHISLSTWFRDYLYIPMGGSRAGLPRWVLAIMVTFTVSGLWHGANWTYVAWGALNGVYLLVGVATKNFRDRFYGVVGLGKDNFARRCVAVGTTFALTLGAWVLFRARNLNDAGYILTHWFSHWNFSTIKTPQFQLKYFPAAIAGLIALEAIQLLQPKFSFAPRFARSPIFLRWAVYMAVVFSVILFGVFRQTQFIYFQF
ncbi:MAG TPA: MBOAT family O-acyltransferase [Verrucomicrobiae bacterium]|nr:MBOAT family O-acyltransferase [Verrucomicrobiae bacterium]